MKLNSEHSFELANKWTNKCNLIKAIYWLNPTVCELNNLNICTVNAIQKKFV